MTANRSDLSHYRQLLETSLPDPAATPINLRCSVVLASGKKGHYFHTLCYLAKRGWLKRFICGAVLSRRNIFMRALPEKSTRRLLDRAVPLDSRSTILSFWYGELLVRALKLLPRADKDALNNFYNILFDRYCARNLPEAKVYHVAGTYALESAEKARKLGAIVILDSGNCHAAEENKIFAEEFRVLRREFPRWRRVLEARQTKEYDLADYIVVPSSYARSTFLDAGLNPAKVLVAGLGVDISTFTPSCRKPKTFTVLYVGQLSIRKGTHYLIEAIRKLRHLQIRWVLIGQLHAEIKPYMAKISTKVEYYTHVVHQELPRWYRTASVFVLPSLSDSFGLVVYEAMASGIPVIITENCGAEIDNGVQGFVVPARDAEAIADRIAFLYEQEEIKREMGQAARRKVEQQTWERYELDLDLVYARAFQKVNS